MVAILFSLLGCETAPSPPIADLPPAKLVSLHQPFLGDGHRFSPPHRKAGRIVPPAMPQDDPGGYDISQYHLIGVMWGGERPQALVEDPSGTTSILQVGSPLGRADGRVAEISQDGVEIVEEFRSSTGEVLALSHTLTLE